MTSFSEATRVSPAAAGAAGQYQGTIVPGWDIGGNTHGGYTLAIAARAMLAQSGRSDPISITAHYLRPGRPGPVEVNTSIIKTGKTFTTVDGTLIREGKPMLKLLGAFGELGVGDADVSRVDAAPPELPPLDACVPPGVPEANPHALHQRIEARLHPDDAGFFRGKPSGNARMTGWFRLRDGEEMDGIALLLAVDAFPPTIFNANLPIAWTPTVELTAHVRARPVPGWLRARFTTRFVTGGFMEEDGELWDDTGTLVAQSRQLALLPKSSG